MKIHIVSILIFTHGIIFAKCEHKLLKMFLANMMECFGQASKNFSTETCQEMLLEGNDNSLAKYDECKCVGACTAKRMQLINEKGEPNYEKFKEFATSMGSESWVQEIDVVFDKCKNIKNTGNECEYVFQWINCGLLNSKMTTELVKAFSGNFKNSSDTGMERK